MSNYKKTVHNKLIRDNVPELLSERGIECSIKVLQEHEYIDALQKKLQEEVTEFFTAKGKEHQIEELADVLEVVRALVAVTGATMDELENVRLEKGKKRGAFQKRLFLEQTSEQ
jgi:predicted house-cleaning noncanonical NTP pyrophosphatase (MazG superfamily)